MIGETFLLLITGTQILRFSSGYQQRYMIRCRKRLSQICRLWEQLLTMSSATLCETR